MRISIPHDANWGAAGVLPILFVGSILFGSFGYDVGWCVLGDDASEVQNLLLSFLRHSGPPGLLFCVKDKDPRDWNHKSVKYGNSQWTMGSNQRPSPKGVSSSSPHLSVSLPRMLSRKLYISESDCMCRDGYTSAPSGSPCGCVIPIQVGLELAVALDTLFPLVIELAKELADGSFLQQSQVRIMKVNAVGDDKEKTDVQADLVPLGVEFDNTTAQLIAQRFWTKQVDINETLFGNYSILYVDYPGLSRSQASALGPIGSPSGGTGSGTVYPSAGRRVKASNKLRRGVTAIIVLCSAVASVIILGAIWLVGFKCRGNKSADMVDPTYVSSVKVSDFGSTMPTAMYSSSTRSLSSSFTAYNGSARSFSLIELEKATDNFKITNVVGEGAFGRVFRGELEDGVPVAVKVLTQDAEQDGREYLAEAELLSRLHHRNLVKLLGVCAEGNIRSLVYELIPNGSLESHLHGSGGRFGPLNWDARIKIALGAARGLAYLHEDSNPRIIHRDFKASNILLDDDFTPKISDFGLAKVASEGGSEHVSTRVMGTFGYVAPEYAMTGHLLVKSDVYSYGVVLLELLSGKKPVDMSQPPGQENLVAWARPLLANAEHLEQLLDPALSHMVPIENLAKVAAIASMCVQPEVSHRPFMGEVVQALKIVYNESEVSEERPSLNGSHAGDFSSVVGNRTELFGGGSSYRPRSTVATESGPLHVECESLPVRPVSASAVSSYSSRFVRQLSGSFRRHGSSGPLKTIRSRPAWYRVRYRRGTMSEHSNTHFEIELDRDYFEFWP